MAKTSEIETSPSGMIDPESPQYGVTLRFVEEYKLSKITFPWRNEQKQKVLI